MKVPATIITRCLLFASVTCAYGQQTETQETQPAKTITNLSPVQSPDTGKLESSSIFVQPEKMPQFPGGEAAMTDFLVKNIRYPESLIGSGKSGKVICSFRILETGSISDIEVVRGVCPEMDNEAVRLIQSMPDWIPGDIRGKPSAFMYTLPITFKDTVTKQ